MRRLLNGRERDPLCACQHGPAVHRDGRCVFEDKCGCPVWNPVPYVYEEDTQRAPSCPRCAVLEAALRALGAPVPVMIPAARAPHLSEHRHRSGRPS
jgi:hypothetical protein